MSGDAAAGSPEAPVDLAATGLYADAKARLVAQANLPYTPQYPLWSDGAAKRRWIYLPPGRRIDASNADVWIFPVGTKLWKEFSFNGRPVETRLMEATGRGRWRFSTYVWNASGTAAVRASEQGIRGVVEIGPGIRHDIPGVADCRTCHEGMRTEVLGFSALQLSSERDPLAPHAEPVPAGAVDLTLLIKRGRLAHAPRDWADRPPRIEAPTPIARAALGYLHANCGSCHSPSGPLESRGLILRHPVALTTRGEPAIDTTRERPTRTAIPSLPPGRARLLSPGAPDESSIVYRMATRNPVVQMPPLATKIVDADAVGLVRRWIGEIDSKPASETVEQKQEMPKERKQ
jgi:hypothetical protein